jgi:hypothetical protein
MPKVSRVGRSRNKLVVDAPVENEADANDGPDPKEILSRGQRKRMLKRQQYLKREQMVLSTLKIKKFEDQKGRLDGMDAIKDALTQTIQKNKQLSKQPEEVIDPSTDSLKSNKAKQKIAQKEMTHMNLVLQHPSFKSNPFATMQEHLRNSLAKQAEEQEITAKSERIQEAIQTAEKKVARKERIRDAKFEKTRRKGRRRR